jgi:hypothetical protein
MADKVTPEIRRIWVEYWTECDRHLGEKIEVMLKWDNAVIS